MEVNYILSEQEYKFLKNYILHLKEQVKMKNPNHFLNREAYADACGIPKDDKREQFFEMFRIETEDPPCITFIKKIQ